MCVTSLTDWDRSVDDSASAIPTIEGYEGGPMLQTVIQDEELNRSWLIMGEKGATSDWHVDASGYSTVVHCELGEKVWWIRVPHEDGRVEIPVSELDDNEFPLPSSTCKVLPLLLKSGETL